MLSQTDILNSESHMEDCGYSIAVLAYPDAYENNPIIQSLDGFEPELDRATLMLYDEDTMQPDSAIRTNALSQFILTSALNQYSSSRFIARKINFPSVDST